MNKNKFEVGDKARFLDGGMVVTIIQCIGSVDVEWKDADGNIGRCRDYKLDNVQFTSRDFL